MPFTRSNALRELTHEVNVLPAKVALHHLANQWEFGASLELNPIHIRLLDRSSHRRCQLLFYTADNEPYQRFSTYILFQRIGFFERLALKIRESFTPGMMTAYIQSSMREIVRQHIRPNHDHEDNVVRNWMSVVNYMLSKFAIRDTASWYCLTPHAKGIRIITHDRHKRYRFEAVFQMLP